MASWWNDYANNVVQGISFVDPSNDTIILGAAIDMRDAQEGLHAQLMTGAVTDGTHSIFLEESEDGTTNFTAILDFITGQPAIFAPFTSADSNVSRSLNFKRSKRFVRARVSVVGATLGGTYGVAIHGMRRRVIG